MHKVVEEATRAWRPRGAVPRRRSAAPTATFRSILSRWMLDWTDTRWMMTRKKGIWIDIKNVCELKE